MAFELWPSSFGWTPFAGSMSGGSGPLMHSAWRQTSEIVCFVFGVVGVAP